jgi:hypothetical protein
MGCAITTMRQLSWAVPLSILSAAFALSGCVPLAVTAAGVGGGVAASHTLGGITYRTFTSPAANVKTASLGALNRMGLKYSGSAKGEHGAEILKARATDRDIEITLEPLSPSSTRMKVVARNGGIFYDSATATEIILQTERQLVGKA